MAFNYRQSLRGEIVAKGEPVHSGVSTTSFPNDFKNIFAARLRDNNINPEREPPDVFSNEDAKEFAKSKIPTFDNVPNFERPQDNWRAEDFLRKYRATSILKNDEKASAESTLGYIAGDPKSNLRNVFPGSNGTEVS